MTPKTTSPVVTAGAKKGLVPKLRFPEFRDASEWDEYPLSSVATVAMGSSPKSECYNENGDGLPLLQGNADIKNRLSAPRIFTSEVTKECHIGDILMSVRAPVGSVAKSIHHACIGRGIAAIHSKEPNSQEFIYQWLLSYEPRWVNVSQGGTFDAINSDDLKGVSLTTPLPDEQQKIADCLSSLDDLIAAQTRKADALKTHKKGLMQRLFPRECETQPQRRFPEWYEAGDWLARPFDDFVTKSFYGTSSSTSEIGQYPVLRMGNMLEGRLLFSNLVYLDLDRQSFEKIHLQPGDILMNRTNSLALVGKISMFDQNIDCITASYIVTYRVDTERMNPAFCNLMLNTPHYQAKINALARPSVSQVNINPTTFRKELIVSVPSLEEQERIANCLTSLDDLITATIQELDTLKTHKKGLMQQLFPSAEALET